MVFSLVFNIFSALKLQKMNLSVPLQKMTTKLEDVVQYTFDLKQKLIIMNMLIGKKIKLHWTGEVLCNCGRVLKKFYRSGFCYFCYWNSPLASQSIFRPELCTAHLGIEERDLEWEKRFQLAPHYVYLANSSGIKVGITRSTQKITRWMDQGASQAILFAEVPNRRFAGDIEVVLKKYVNDITNWRKMLSGQPISVNLVTIKNKLSVHVPDEMKQYILADNTITEINYPVTQYPKRIKSLKLEKSNIIEGELLGIKGQYLLLDNDRVFNVRRHEGFISFFYSYDIVKQAKLF